eukprot:818317-Pelagomonas_calceolata.AAC.1
MNNHLIPSKEGFGQDAQDQERKLSMDMQVLDWKHMSDATILRAHTQNYKENSNPTQATRKTPFASRRHNTTKQSTLTQQTCAIYKCFTQGAYPATCTPMSCTLRERDPKRT